jgi:hypothetical protein
MEIAPLVNLDPAREFDDCPEFDQRRSHIPTALFREIVTDMGLILLQYGPMQCHRTEEARSKFLAPVCAPFLLGPKFFKYPPDPQSLGRTVWRCFPEQTRANNWLHCNKREDRVPPQVFRHPNGCVR